MTIVYQGEVAHRDTTGNSGVIGPGDVQWMTAASGVLHEEFHSPAFTQKGGTLEMTQLWVNLAGREKMSAPRYQAILDAQIPAVALPEDAGTLRVIAGDYEGAKGPALTYSPMNVWGTCASTPATALHSRCPKAGPRCWCQVAVGDMSMVIGQTTHFTRTGEAIAIEAEKDSLALLAQR